MICFRDMTFCSASCKTTECRRNFTEETRQASIQWGGEHPPVAFSDYSHDCPDYEPLDEPQRCAECDCEHGGADCNWTVKGTER